MTELQETISNPLVQLEIEYCRHIFRERQYIPLEFRRSLEETGIPIGSQEAQNLAMAEEHVCKLICSNIIIAREELEALTSVSWKDVVARLRSSKEYPTDRASPTINKLSQIWVLFAIGLKRVNDINRIHRNLLFDITSSDPVEDFLRIEFPIDILRIPSKYLPQLSPEILQFCSRQRILGYLSTAINIVERSFSSISELKIHLEQDPENGEKWIVLNVTIQGEVTDALNSYDDYTGHLISSVPWPERHKIRLSYNII